MVDCWVIDWVEKLVSQTVGVLVALKGDSVVELTVVLMVAQRVDVMAV